MKADDKIMQGATGPFLDDDFELLQLGEEIKDAKFETEPIGFLKDATLRLCRNKAAIAAFVMILLAGGISYLIFETSLSSTT